MLAGRVLTTCRSFFWGRYYAIIRSNQGRVLLVKPFYIHEYTRRISETIELALQQTKGDEITSYQHADAKEVAGLISPYYEQFWQEYLASAK